MGEFACVPCRCTVPRDPKGCSKFPQVSKRKRASEQEREREREGHGQRKGGGRKKKGGREEKKEEKRGSRPAENRERRGRGKGLPPLGPSTPMVEGIRTPEGGRIEDQQRKRKKNVKKNSGRHWCSTEPAL